MHKNKINFEKLLFYISYFLFALYAFFGTIPQFRETLKMLTNVGMGVILFVLIFQLKTYKKDELIKTIFLILISFVFVFVSKNNLILKLTLIVLISKNIDFDIKIKFDVRLRIIFLITMILFYNVGIAEDTIYYYNNKLRHSLGFSNPNVLGLHAFILCLELLYLKRKNLSLKNIILYSSIMLISNYYSGSRTALYLYIVSAIMFYMYNKNNKIFNNKVIKKIIIYSPIITTIFVYISYILYINNNPIGNFIDMLTSGRLLNIKFFANNYKISLLGTDISVANKSCDTAIVYMLFSFRYIGAIMYIVGFKKLISILYKKEYIGIVIIIFIFMLYGVSEKLWLFADCNLLLTAISFIIYNNKEVAKNGE